MQTSKHAVIVLTGLALLVVVLGATPALAQAAPPQQPPAQAEKAKQPPPQAETAEQPAPVEGELVRVEAEAKKVAIKTADGAEVEFLYTDDTEVSGAKDGAAGLVTMKEGRVTIHFTEDAEAKTKTATRIIIQPKQ